MGAGQARRGWSSAAGVGLGAVLLSCAPEIGPPTWPVVTARYSYATPEATLRSIATALAARQQGISGYLAAFADSTGPGDPAFHQYFDPVDVAFLEAVCQCQAPVDWGRAQEQAFYLAFLGVRPNDRYSAVFDSVDSNPDPPPTDTRTLLHRSYRILATEPGGNSTLIIAIGFADLTFTRTSGDRWVITRWDDHVDPGVGVNPLDPYQLTLGRRRLESSR